MSESGASAEQLVEELRKTRVSDLLAATCSMLASLAYGKLAPEIRDLEQARLAIDAVKALEPLLPAEAQRDVQQVVANLQLAYADVALGKPAETADDPGHEPQAEEDEGAPEREADAGTSGD